MQIITIKDRKFLTELESLQDQVESRQALLAYIINSNQSITNNTNFQLYEKEYFDVYKNYNLKKHELEQKFIKPIISTTVTWSLDFITGELTINDNQTS